MHILCLLLQPSNRPAPGGAHAASAGKVQRCTPSLTGRRPSVKNAAVGLGSLSLLDSASAEPFSGGILRVPTGPRKMGLSRKSACIVEGTEYPGEQMAGCVGRATR